VSDPLAKRATIRRVVEGDYEGSRERVRRSVLTEPLTPGHLRELVGEMVSVLDTAQVRYRGVLLDVVDVTIVLEQRQSDDVITIAIADLVQVRRMGSNSRASAYAYLRSKIDSLERDHDTLAERVARLEGERG